MGQTKRSQEIAKVCDVNKTYSITEAVLILKKVPPIKFDATVDLSVKLGTDPRRPEQNVRGTVSLPHGTGKSIRVLVVARGEKIQEALAAGAHYAGAEELLEKVLGGWTDFDAVIATPDMMREVGKLGKVLGPRGLMPSPKAGTVTSDVVKALKELQAGKIEFKLDRHGVINSGVGKISFSDTQLVENIEAFLQAIFKAKPAAAKGQYLLSIFLSSTMGPGIKVTKSEGRVE